ncbi:hypothetical protein [Mesorhizobium sp. NZP2298]|uniref:hypothetical protein n=1 Tax=Mesorhizobium sp. NZP2298 TaxID=2483403 RepID=UPI0019D55C4D|nr:hypothetical protein [Mesorhizobium sp. NZP2298]
MATGTRGVVVEQPPLEGVPVNNSIFGVGKGGFYDPVDTVGFGSSQVVRLTSLDWLGPLAPCQPVLLRGLARLALPVLAKGRDHRDDAASDRAQAALRQPPGLWRRPCDERARRGNGDANTLRVRVLAGADGPPCSTRATYLRRRLLAACGIHPRARSFRHRHKRGAFVALLREIRGLPPMPEREPGVQELSEIYGSRPGTNASGG